MEEKVTLLEAENKALKNEGKMNENDETMGLNTQNVSEAKNVGNEHTPVFKCNECGKEFSRNVQLERHVKSDHSKEKLSKQYNCNKCEFTQESEAMLKEHLAKHNEHEPLFKCNDCGKEFSRNMQLERHVKSYHSHQNLAKQYNCEDCAFQGENRIELKRHLQRTKHCPSDLKEECYTCKMEFASYWHLMNHRKIEHPSTKMCRYFKKGCCEFSDEECWYSHVEAHQFKAHEVLSPENSCKECDEIFGTKTDMMK